jgi:hypothetical protein
VTGSRKKIGKEANKGENSKIVYAVKDKEFQNEV